MPLNESDKQKVEERTSLFLKLAQAVFSNYEAWFNEEPPSPRVFTPVQRVIFTEDAYYTTLPENALAPHQSVLNSHIDEILSYEATIAYIEQCKNNALFGAISEDANFVERGVIRNNVSAAITNPLAFIIDQHRTFHPTKEHIEQ